MRQTQFFSVRRDPWLNNLRIIKCTAAEEMLVACNQWLSNKVSSKEVKQGSKVKEGRTVAVNKMRK